MDVHQMLSKEPIPTVEDASKQQIHTHTTRRTSQYGFTGDSHSFGSVRSGLNAPTAFQAEQTSDAPKKLVCFKLLISDTVQQTARLPLKVYVSPHDTTDSIISTTKNFYGLYEGQGVSFEDEHGVSLIARYENLGQNSTVFVRVRDERPVTTSLMHRTSFQSTTMSPPKPWLDEPIQLHPSPSFRVSSPSKAHRTGSVRGSKPRESEDAANGHSDSDAGSVSVSSSRRAKSDCLASAEISLENIVEGGRRKRAKFESSELPLFIPPQVPITASMSSASPQRKGMHGNAGSPYYNGFGYQNVLPSPQSWGKSEGVFGLPNPQGINGSGQRLRGKSSGNLQASRLSGGANVLPTPDPTIGGSVISDEDVALQLMRLGDPGNFSYGRLSNSTMDDTLSGKAEAASSVENSDADSDADMNDGLLPGVPRKHSHGPLHSRKKMKNGESAAVTTYDSGAGTDDEYEDDHLHHHSHASIEDGKFGMMHDGIMRGKMSKPGMNRTSSMSSKSGSKPKLSGAKIKQVDAGSKSTAGSNSTGTPRKSSAVSLPPLADDEEDLSSRPRCQRCRKSKKGCDRQRPCGRCRDAGIGIEGCISEDEGNGRKGRYGRHMGVVVKKEGAEPVIVHEHPQVMSLPMDLAASLNDAAKKRKR